MTTIIAGVDEVGRGPLFGPVVAAAVVLDPAQPIADLNDSKKLTEKKREALYEQIMAQALAVGIGRAEVAEIDRINILQASFVAMQRAVQALPIAPHEVLVDGNKAPEFACPARAIVGGDALEPAISAASIIAKVTRDREIVTLAAQWPDYGLAKHKGYPTVQHLAAIREHGITPLHRRSFAPVKKLLAQAATDDV